MVTFLGDQRSPPHLFYACKWKDLHCIPKSLFAGRSPPLPMTLQVTGSLPEGQIFHFPKVSMGVSITQGLHHPGSSYIHPHTVTSAFAGEPCRSIFFHHVIGTGSAQNMMESIGRGSVELAPTHPTHLLVLKSPGGSLKPSIVWALV